MQGGLTTRSAKNSNRKKKTERLGLAGQPALEPCDLAIVMRFVFAHVKPSAVIVRRTVGGIGIHLHKPGIISLFQLGQSVRPHLLESIEVIKQLVAPYAFSRF